MGINHLGMTLTPHHGDQSLRYTPDPRDQSPRCDQKVGREILVLGVTGGKHGKYWYIYYIPVLVNITDFHLTGN